MSDGFWSQHVRDLLKADTVKIPEVPKVPEVLPKPNPTVPEPLVPTEREIPIEILSEVSDLPNIDNLE